MATSTVPGLIDALIAAADAALTDVKVLDGFGATDEPGDYLMVGVDDPDREDDALSVDVKQEPGPFGTNRPRDEDGEIYLTAHSWNGDGNQKAARDAVYAIDAAVEDLCRANPKLGVAGVLWTGFGSQAQLMQNQTQSGARAFLTFRISFRSRI